MDKADAISDMLRSSGYGVTSIDAAGKDEKRKVLMVFANRHGSSKITELVESVAPEAVVVVNDIISLKGGYVKNRRQIRK